MASSLPMGLEQGHISLMKSSWYGSESGTTRADGQHYDPMALTVAHRTLTFGTRLLLMNPTNGRQVVAVVADRGPFVKGRSLDCSKGVAIRLGFLRQGVAELLAVTLYDVPSKSVRYQQLQTAQTKVRDSYALSPFSNIPAQLKTRHPVPLHHSKNSSLLFDRANCKDSVDFHEGDTFCIPLAAFSLPDKRPDWIINGESLIFQQPAPKALEHPQLVVERQLAYALCQPDALIVSNVYTCKLGATDLSWKHIKQAF